MRPTVVLPTIHINGTSKRALLDALENAVGACRRALQAIEETAPNGRDYYVRVPSDFREAEQDYLERLRRVQTVRDELMAIWTGIVDSP